MTKVLITGATGNVGMEVINALGKVNHNMHLFAGVKGLNEDKGKFSGQDIEFIRFDFTDSSSYKPGLTGCDILFLLRPPQISGVEKYFKPIIDTCKELGVKHIVFLSVQGVEKSSIIPHHKIEKLIVDSQIDYTFLRPAYFMQNFTTTLHNDLVKSRLIYLPAGNAKFTLVDVRDIGTVAAEVLTNTPEHINKSYELTCNEKLTFTEMAEMLSNHLAIKIQFKSPSLFSFFLTKRKEKMPTMLIIVMIMLHYLPRFQKSPDATNLIEKLTGKQPISFQQFITDNRAKLQG